MLEVEIKAKIEIESIRKRLGELRAKFINRTHQKDIYFRHPCHDFKKTDEALRVRKVKDEYFLTYKGTKLDPETKTRREIQIRVEKGVFNLLKSLGFSPIGEVEKWRSFYQWKDLKIYLDEVKGLGNFLELEGTSWKDKEKMFTLLKKLGIGKRKLTRKSYLELLESQIEK
ncbi:MAG: class IV adenylate cyclase [bacterium]